jgi:hypothetical protein
VDKRIHISRVPSWLFWKEKLAGLDMEKEKFDS